MPSKRFNVSGMLVVHEKLVLRTVELETRAASAMFLDNHTMASSLEGS
jgi:hypothetical protein